MDTIVGYCDTCDFEVNSVPTSQLLGLLFDGSGSAIISLQATCPICSEIVWWIEGVVSLADWEDKLAELRC